jgi:hypothetical protein
MHNAISLANRNYQEICTMSGCFAVARYQCSRVVKECNVRSIYTCDRLDWSGIIDQANEQQHTITIISISWLAEQVLTRCSGVLSSLNTDTRGHLTFYALSFGRGQHYVNQSTSQRAVAEKIERKIRTCASIGLILQRHIVGEFSLGKILLLDPDTYYGSEGVQ